MAINNVFSVTNKFISDGGTPNLGGTISVFPNAIVLATGFNPGTNLLYVQFYNIDVPALNEPSVYSILVPAKNEFSWAPEFIYDRFDVAGSWATSTDPTKYNNPGVGYEIYMNIEVLIAP